MSDEDFIALPADEREKINGMRREVLAKMSEINPVVMELEKERRDSAEDYMEASIRQLVAGNMAGIRQRAEEDPPLADFLCLNLQIFLRSCV